MPTPLDAVLAEYRDSLEQLYGARLVRLVLFGSVARGDANDGSDIDILVILTGPLDDWKETQRTSAVTSELSIKFDTDISRCFATPEDYATKTESFFENVRREGIAV